MARFVAMQEKDGINIRSEIIDAPNAVYAMGEFQPGVNLLITHNELQTQARMTTPDGRVVWEVALT
jgi:hypothetical protein